MPVLARFDSKQITEISFMFYSETAVPTGRAMKVIEYVCDNTSGTKRTPGSSKVLCVGETQRISSRKKTWVHRLSRYLWHAPVMCLTLTIRAGGTIRLRMNM